MTRNEKCQEGIKADCPLHTILTLILDNQSNSYTYEARTKKKIKNEYTRINSLLRLLQKRRNKTELI